jgi:hypothetical protein
MAMTFEYSDSPQFSYEQDNFILEVPSGIGSKAGLLMTLSGAGRFPGYVGHNWDALLDCLRDLSWLGSRIVVIVHSDVPLQHNPIECRIYLEVLETALADWSSTPKRDAASEPSPDWPYAEHKLRVIFPPGARAMIARILEGGIQGH